MAERVGFNSLRVHNLAERWPETRNNGLLRIPVFTYWTLRVREG
jgi:hypothetical protein